ncbi:hypothetical protein B0T19DRAFT_442570 [Cercophora scortea]|uniref:Uncharacterized protein n=1 Tax=Cercophora scortea TaxID=314031 RepID=A0AAE0MDR0_9PEZI|nr:hypothetical protein B0T19DRAFT_442570 [Cercophora scortea]
MSGHRNPGGAFGGGVTFPGIQKSGSRIDVRYKVKAASQPKHDDRDKVMLYLRELPSLKRQADINRRMRRVAKIDTVLKEAEGSEPTVLSMSYLLDAPDNVREEQNVYTDKVGGDFIVHLHDVIIAQNELIDEVTQRANARLMEYQARGLAAENKNPSTAAPLPITETGRIFWEAVSMEQLHRMESFVEHWADTRFRSMTEIVDHSGNIDPTNTLQVYRREIQRQEGADGWLDRVYAVNTFMHGGDLSTDVFIIENEEYVTLRHGKHRFGYFRAAFAAIYGLDPQAARFLLNGGYTPAHMPQSWLKSAFKTQVDFINKVVAVRDKEEKRVFKIVRFSGNAHESGVSERGLASKMQVLMPAWAAYAEAISKLNEKRNGEYWNVTRPELDEIERLRVTVSAKIQTWIEWGRMTEIVSRHGWWPAEPLLVE